MRASDLPFLERLYRVVRWEELQATGWTDEEKRAFLAGQFALQHRHYATYYGGAEFAVLVHRDEPIGRLYLFRGRVEHRIVDVALLDAWRGAGIGTALLEAACADAAARGCAVTIHVEQFNPALRLYRRLGFREVGTDGPYHRLEWRLPLGDAPSGAQVKTA